MDANPTVSVVLPTYNQADELTGAIDSVLAQTFEDLELLVVDDGSDDSTESTVKSYDDPRVTYIGHDRNRGCNPARNTGVKAATGEYVAFIDSDDRWSPRKLEVQLDDLRTRSDEWVGVYCDYAKERTGPIVTIEDVLSDRVFRNPRVKQGGEEMIRNILLLRIRIGPGSTLLARRDAVEAVGAFDESLSVHGDWDLLIRLLHDGKLSYVDEKLVTLAPSPYPPADEIRRAKETFLGKHADLVDRLESEGYDVTYTQQFFLAGFYLKEGNYREGMRYLAPTKIVFKPDDLLRCLWWLLIP